jgi:SulP family sulfate permease
VVVGFTAGAAVLIAASQVKNFFGIAIPRGSSVAKVLQGLVENVGHINLFITAVAVVTVVSCVAAKRWWPKVPHMIVGMVSGSVLAFGLNAQWGLELTGITSIGALQIGLPPLSMPDLSAGTLQQLAPIAFAVALLALTEAVSIARAMALKSGQRIDGNQEFIGQGLSNLAGSFFSGYASSGSFNRSGLNLAAGAKTPLAAVYSAVFLLLIMLFLAPLAKYLPVAAMAGILFVVAWGLIDFHAIVETMRASRSEATILFATLIATLTIELEFAIYIGVGLSLLMYLKRTSQPSLDDVKPVPGQMPPAFSDSTGLEDCPQLKIVRINGSIFFGAANHLQEALQRIDETEPQHTHVLLVASGINFVDLTGAHMLAQEAQRRRAMGGALSLFNVKEEPMEMLRRSGAYETIGADNFFAMGDDVMATLKGRLNQSICSRCTARIFSPCKA